MLVTPVRRRRRRRRTTSPRPFSTHLLLFVILLLVVLLQWVGWTSAGAATVVAAASEDEEETNDDDDDDDDELLSLSLSYDVWEEGDQSDLYDALQCEESPPEEGSSSSIPLTVHSMDTWKLLQMTYVDVVTPEKSSLPRGGFLGMDGFYVPYRVGHGPHGRGIVATQNIPKGTLIWKSFQTARLETGDHYRRFLKALPVALACDVSIWAYTRIERIPDDEYGEVEEEIDHEDEDEEELSRLIPRRVVACVDLDPGSFVNGCDTEWECNMVLSMPRDSGCVLEFHADRDIQAGEELRIDYGFSEYDAGWAALGLNSEVRPLRLYNGKKKVEKGIQDEL